MIKGKRACAKLSIEAVEGNPSIEVTEEVLEERPRVLRAFLVVLVEVDEKEVSCMKAKEEPVRQSE